MARVSRRLAPIAGLRDGRLAAGQTVILWCAAPSAPVDAVEHADGMALVLGDALARAATVRTSARVLHDAWSAPAPTRDAYDGYFAAVSVRADRVVVGGDLLGLFPIYTAARDACFVASSTPSAFDAHPHFDGPVAADGLFGYLLTGGPFAGGTLRAGVRRLDAGTRLRWRAGEAPAEERVFSWPSTAADRALAFEAQLERLEAAQDAAVRRHTAGHARLSVLLSGGRDSRTLVGHLARTGREASAVTLGDATDHDARCATAVARTLRMPHRVHAVEFARFPEFADRTVAHERLANGMSAIHSWAAVDALRETGGAVLSGYLLEVRQIPLLPATRTGMLDWMHARAMTPHALRAIVRPEYHAAIGDAMTEVHRHVDALEAGTDVAEVPMRCLMAGYARFHAGAVPSRLAFAAWPVLPIVDQALLEVMCSIPREFLAGRRMQDALLRTRFPALARLPLDRNADDVRPLLERPWERALTRARAVVQARVGRMRQDPPSGGPTGATERRYYARMYDFDNPGWRLVRASAEPGRAAAGEWFDPAALAALVPPPSVAAAHADPIAQGFAPKALTGCLRLLALHATGNA